MQERYSNSINCRLLLYSEVFVILKICSFKTSNCIYFNIFPVTSLLKVQNSSRKYRTTRKNAYFNLLATKIITFL
jgi:hypothetical protein